MSLITTECKVESSKFAFRELSTWTRCRNGMNPGKINSNSLLKIIAGFPFVRIKQRTQTNPTTETLIPSQNTTNATNEKKKAHLKLK